MNSIVKTIEVRIYTPSFDPDSGLYKDILPYKHRERNRITYACPCKSGTMFSSTPQFRSHINSTCHQNYIENYSFFQKEINEEKEINKQLKYDKEILTRKLNKKEDEFNVLESDHNKLVIAFTKYCDKSKRQNDKFRNILSDIKDE